ncbi:hypothetical protein AB7Z49_01365 [Providencia rettgeri]
MKIQVRPSKYMKLNTKIKKTILDQKLTVEKTEFGRINIDIAMDDFPKIDNEQDAILKYGDWLERLGIAIRREAKRAIKRGVE